MRRDDTRNVRRPRVSAAGPSQGANRSLSEGRRAAPRVHHERRGTHPHEGAAGVRLPLRAGGAVGRRQDEPRRGAARARARHPPVRVVHDARAASRRDGRRALSLRRRAALSRAEGQGRVPGARVRARPLVRDVRHLAFRPGGPRPRRPAGNRLAGRGAGAPADAGRRPHLHPAAVARPAARAARKARPGLPRGHPAPPGRRARRNAPLRRLRLCYYESGLCTSSRRPVRDRARGTPDRSAADGASCAAPAAICWKIDRHPRGFHGPHHDRRLPRKDSQPLRADARGDQPCPADLGRQLRRWSTPTATSRPSSPCARSPRARSASKCC